MKEKMRLHKMWLESNGKEGERAIFTNLTGEDLSGMDLSGCSFAKNISSCNFTGADLRLADFNDCIIKNTCFDNANLEMTSFVRVDFEAVSFNNATLDYAYLYLSKIKYGDFNCVTFVRSDLSGIKAEQVDFSGSRFIGTDMTNSNIKESNLEAADFTGSDMSGAKIESCRIVLGIFSNTRVVGTEFLNSDMVSCVTETTDLSQASIISSNDEFRLLDTKWGKIPAYLYDKINGEYKALSLETFKFFVIKEADINSWDSLAVLDADDRKIIKDYCKTYFRTKEMMAPFRGIKKHFSKKCVGM